VRALPACGPETQPRAAQRAVALFDLHFATSLHAPMSATRSRRRGISPGMLGFSRPTRMKASTRSNIQAGAKAGSEHRNGVLDARLKFFELADIASTLRGKMVAVISPIGFEPFRSSMRSSSWNARSMIAAAEARVACRSDIAPLVNDLIIWMRQKRAKHSRHSDFDGLHSQARRRSHMLN